MIETDVLNGHQYVPVLPALCSQFTYNTSKLISSNQPFEGVSNERSYILVPISHKCERFRFVISRVCVLRSVKPFPSFQHMLRRSNEAGSSNVVQLRVHFVTVKFFKKRLASTVHGQTIAQAALKLGLASTPKLTERQC